MGRSEQAVMVWYDPLGCEVVQREMFTCSHCQTAGFVGVDDGGMCLRCNRLLCKDPGCYDDCTPIAAMFGYGDEKRLQRAFDRNRGGVLLG